MCQTNLSSYKEWQLIKQLGAGGFGEVLLWKNRSTQQEIATKRLKKSVLSDDEAAKLKQRWLQEYQWMRNLNTPFIVCGIDLKDQDFINYLNENHEWHPLPVIVMEYCNSGDLRAHLQKVENINGLHEFEVREVLHALRHAIEYLHSQCHIEHRDLKPDNVVIHTSSAGKRCYKLTDFGFARNTTENTILKSVVGTRHYFAPEVVDTAQYTNTVDYWSLGVIAFELMCGILPFIPHQQMYNIIVNIKNKPRSCIAITEDPVEHNRFQFETKLSAENLMSSVFLKKMEKWLPMALDKNYKTRGCADESIGSNINASKNLQFYIELDGILQSKILTVFCLSNYKFYAYEVTTAMSMIALCEEIESSMGIQRQNLYFVLPTGHPCGQLTMTTRPIDLFVSQWQDAGENQQPPVMLYVVDVKQDFNPAEPHIPALVKRCLQLSGNSNEKPLPEWVLQHIARQVHFLLTDQHRHSKALISGLQEYALTLENEITYFDTTVQDMLDRILIQQGGVKQFTLMVNAALQTYEKKLPETIAIIKSFINTCNELQDKIEKIYNSVGKTIKKRYTSALRRIREQATSKLFHELSLNDFFELSTYRQLLMKISTSKIPLDVNQRFIYNCMEARNKFLNDDQLKVVRAVTVDVQQEFFKIKKIVQDTVEYLLHIEMTLRQQTMEFHEQLAGGCARINCAQPLSQSIRLNGSIFLPSTQNICNIPTERLIAEAQQNIELMSIDFMDANDSNKMPSGID